MNIIASTIPLSNHCWCISLVIMKLLLTNFYHFVFFPNLTFFIFFTTTVTLSSRAVWPRQLLPQPYIPKFFSFYTCHSILWAYISHPPLEIVDSLSSWFFSLIPNLPIIVPSPLFPSPTCAFKSALITTLSSLGILSVTSSRSFQICFSSSSHPTCWT